MQQPGQGQGGSFRPLLQRLVCSPTPRGFGAGPPGSRDHRLPHPQRRGLRSRLAVMIASTVDSGSYGRRRVALANVHVLADRSLAGIFAAAARASPATARRAGIGGESVNERGSARRAVRPAPTLNQDSGQPSTARGAGSPVAPRNGGTRRVGSTKAAQSRRSAVSRGRWRRSDQKSVAPLPRRCARVTRPAPEL